MTAYKFNSINPVPPIFCEQVEILHRFAQRFVQFPYGRRLHGIDLAPARLFDTLARILNESEIGRVQSNGGLERIFDKVNGARFAQPSRKLLTIDRSHRRNFMAILCNR
jgi:hypothetical protein